MERVLLIGTGLIGASVGLALREAGFRGEILGYDHHHDEIEAALASGAIDKRVPRDEVVHTVADVVILATPVLPILDWMDKLAPALPETALVTDVGSTKATICEKAAQLFNRSGRAHFLPGHPMAGKESGGAAIAEAGLFRSATWLFVPQPGEGEAERSWRQWVGRMGAVVRDVDAETHDQTCAWVSHLPQMLSTALAALLEDTFASDTEKMAAVQAIGGRALRETTRLGASPYSMWRDIALTNTEPIAETLLALEQRLAHLRENLRTPELREEFATANRFRAHKK